MFRRVAIVLLAALTLTVGVGCARRPLGPDAEARKLFETKCTRCHTLDRVAKHDPGEEPWPELVNEMQGKKPGWISDEDAADIVQHLEKTHGAP
jgi:mono/diheme cytochrome c family protein